MLIIIGIVLVVIFFVGVLTARADTNCGSIADIERFVTGAEYSERALFDATVPCRRGECPIKIFGNAKTGTGTIILEVQPGVACIFLTLQNMAPAKQAPEGNPL